MSFGVMHHILGVLTLPDATALDLWVLDHLRGLFEQASTNTTLKAQLHGDKTVFFLHLLGLDTTGHSYRPHSKVRKSTPDMFRRLTADFAGIYEQHSSC